MEVTYFPEGGSITDYVCVIFDKKVGVSVTRAIKYRGQYTEEDAAHLLTKKLKGMCFFFNCKAHPSVRKVSFLYDLQLK